MLIKRAAKLRLVKKDVSSDYVQASSVKTGDETVDINSGNDRKLNLQVSVANIIKNDQAEQLYNGHLGLKSKGISVKAELEGKDLSDYVFARVRAIDACGYEKSHHAVPPNGNNEDLHGANDNGDFFSAEQLLVEKEHEGKTIRAFQTFVGVPFFTNHQNDDIEKARGKIINAFYDLEDNCVYADVRVDAKLYPKLARGIEQGYMTDVSMGTAVEYSLCSICGNKAARADEYCSHIRTAKGKKIGGKRCYEINHGLKFIEISAVTDGACENCKVDQILKPEELLKTASGLNDKLKKTSSVEGSCPMPLRNGLALFTQECFFGISSILQTAGKTTDSKSLADSAEGYYNAIEQTLSGVMANQANGLVKTASKEDLQSLYDALQKLKDVTIKIIKSEDVDYEFVEDLSGVLADLQNLIVDLAEAGFGDVADSSTGQGDMAIAGGQGQMAEDPNAAGGGDPTAEAAGVGAPAGAGAPEGGAGAAQSFEPTPPNPMTGLASTVKRINILGSKLAQINKKSNVSKGENIKNKELNAHKIQTILAQKWDTIMNKKESGLMNSIIEVKDGDFALKIAGNKVSAYHNGTVAHEVGVNELPRALAAAYRENPKEAAEVILRAWRDGLLSEAYTKNAPPQQEVQENQLEGMDGNFSWKRKDDYKEELNVVQTRLDDFEATPETGNTEILLDGTVKDTGESKFTRKNTADDMPVMETRLSQEKRRIHDDVAPEADLTEVRFTGDKYTTKPWTHDGVRDGEDVPTIERQLAGDSKFQPAGKERMGIAIEETFEGQLEHKRQGKDTYSNESNMSTATVAIDRLIKAAARGVIDRGVTPSQMVAAITSLTTDYTDSFSKWAGAFTKNTAFESVNKRIRVKTASTEVSKKDMATILLDRVVDNYISAGQTFVPSIMAQASKTLAQYPAESEMAIKAEVEAELNRIREAASGKRPVQIKEARIEDEFKQALFSKANLTSDEVHEITLTSEDVDGLSPEDANFEAALRAAISDVLSENGVLATEESVELETVSAGANGTIVATARVKNLDKQQARMAALKQVLKKIAQGAPMGGGDMGGGAPAGGDPMGGAGAPAGGGVGALSTPPADFNPEAEGMGEAPGAEGEEETGGNTPVFPGKGCPFCASTSVEAVDDHHVCKDCDTEFRVNVGVEVLNTEKFIDNVDMSGGDEAPADDMSAPAGDETEMSPVSMPAGNPQAPVGMPTMPGGAAPGAMASVDGIPVKIAFTTHPANILATANTLGRMPRKLEPVAAGQRCPNCLSGQCVMKNDSGSCANCGTDYKVAVKANAKKPYLLDVEIDYVAAHRDTEGCEACASAKKSLAKKVASLVSNQSKMVKEANTNTDTELESFKVCVAHRVLDGYSVDTAKVITNSIRKSIVHDLKVAQLKEDDMDNNLEGDDEMSGGSDSGSLTNPLTQNDVTRTMQEESDDDEIGSFLGDIDESDMDDTDEFGSDDLDGDDSDLIIDDGDENDDFLGDSLVDGEDNDGININIQSGDSSVELSIDPETGNVEVQQSASDELDVEDADDGYIETEGDDLEDNLEDGFGDEMADDLEDSVDDMSDDSEESSDDATDFIGDDDSEDESSDEGSDDSSDDSSEDEEIVQESDDSETFAGIENALEMNGNMILPSNRLAGRYLDLSFVAQQIGLSNEDIKEGTSRLAGTHPMFRKQASIQLTKKPNLMAAMKTANSKQTIPLDIEDEVDAGVPRKKEVGLNQNEPKGAEEVIKNKGKDGEYTGVVPRKDKTSFESETGDKQTSGKPDTYVQKVKENVKPTPAGNKENHAVAASEREVIEAFAKKNNITNPSEIEVTDLGPFYLVAHKDKGFKLDKEGYEGPAFEGRVTANFSQLQIRASVNESGELKIEKTVKTASAKKPSTTASKKAANNGRTLMQKAAKAVAKQYNLKVANLEVADYGDVFGILDKSTNKMYEVKKKQK